MIQPIVRLSTVMLLAATVSACGSKAPRPVSEIALADSALKNAESAGAQEHAPIELRVAREKKAAADAAMVDKKYSKAYRLTQEAKADADLARAMADVEKSRLALKEASDNIEMIRTEAIRTGTSN